MKTVCEYTYFESGKKHREPKANPRLMFSCHNQTLIGHTRLKPTVYKRANTLCSAIVMKNINSFKQMHDVSVIAKFIDYRCKSWAHIAETKLMYFLCEEGKSSEKPQNLGLIRSSAPKTSNFLCCGLLMKSKCTLTISGNLIFSCNST